MIQTHITLENETLSGFLFRITGTVDAALLADALERNPTLTTNQLRFPYGQEITIYVPDTQTPVREVETLW